MTKRNRKLIDKKNFKSHTRTVTAIAITKVIIPIIMNTIPRPLAKSGPTEDILRQCGHRAKALFNVLNYKTKFQ
jgi:hypothetical protein